MMEKNDKLNNFYFFFFYVTSMFLKRLNKHNDKFILSSIAFVSSCLMLNFLSIVFILGTITKMPINPKLITISALPILIMNYIFLTRSNTSQRIIAFYDKKYENKKYNPLSVVLIIGYIIFSYGSCISIAYLIRNHLI